jgi:hypothetical protein
LLRISFPIDHFHSLLIQLSVPLDHELLEGDEVVDSRNLINDLPMEGICACFIARVEELFL